MGEKSTRKEGGKTAPSKTLKEKRTAKADKKAASSRSREHRRGDPGEEPLGQRRTGSPEPETVLSHSMPLPAQRAGSGTSTKRVEVSLSQVGSRRPDGAAITRSTASSVRFRARSHRDP